MRSPRKLQSHVGPFGGQRAPEGPKKSEKSPTRATKESKKSQGWTCSRSLKCPLRRPLRCVTVWGGGGWRWGGLLRAYYKAARTGTLRGTLRGTVRGTIKGALQRVLKGSAKFPSLKKEFSLFSDFFLTFLRLRTLAAQNRESRTARFPESRAWNRQRFHSEKQKNESNRSRVESRKIDSESPSESHPINAYSNLGIARFKSHDSESPDSRFRIAGSVPLSFEPHEAKLSSI